MDMQRQRQRDRARAKGWLLALAVVLSVLVGLARGQGIGREDGHVVDEALERHVGTPRDQKRPPVVDLREKLPAVGSQSMNDCAAWAFGYAARSYLEAVDQEWKPDRPERIFSPTFIYNKVNGGKDEGSNPLEVLKLLRDEGAATLYTQPYRSKDFRTAPIPRAGEEAQHFRISSFTAVNDGEGIRNALAAGDIVVVGVRTNPIFSSGRYALYDQAAHTAGIKQRRPGQPHGFHAMVICGYNDLRRSFLFMNSWGADWGNGGYVWVSYDVADTFNTKSDDGERLMDFAVVMHDRREPVKRINGKYQSVPLEELTARNRFRCTGLDEQGRPIYDLTMEVVGPPELMARIERVRWIYTDLGEQRTFAGQTHLRDNHAAILTTRDRDLPLRGVVTLRGRQDVTFDAHLKLPEAMPHAPALRRIDAYSHDGVALPLRPLHRWSMVPEMSELDWMSLASIEWTFTRGVEPRNHPLMRPDLAPAPEKSPFTYRHTYPGRPVEDGQTLAYPSSVSDAPPTGLAVFRFRDGSTYKVDFPADAFPEAPKEDQFVRLAHVARPVGRYAGEEWYYFEVRAHYPEAWNHYWGSGTFDLEGLSHDPFTGTHAGRRTGGLEPSAIVYGGYTQHAFNFDARIKLLRGPAVGRFEAPRPWVKASSLLLGVEGRSSSRSMVSGLVDPVPAEPGIRYLDEYLGLDDDGRPQWAFAPWFTDLRRGYQHELPEVDAWQFNAERVTVERVQEMERGFFTTYLKSHEPIELALPATVHSPFDKDGKRTVEQVTFRATMRPHAPATVGLSLQVLDHLPRELAQLQVPPQWDMVQVNLVGGRRERESVRSIDYLLPLPGGSVQSLTWRVDALEEAATRFNNVRLPAPSPGEPVRAIVTRADGGVMLLEAKPTGYVPYPDAPDLSLSAVSRYHGRIDGRPHWVSTISVDGRLDVRDQIAAVRFELKTEDGRSVTAEPTDDPRVARVVTAVPLRASASVSFKDAAHAARSLTAVVLAPLDRVPADETPRIASQLVRVQQTYMNRNAVNIWEGYEDPVEHHVITLNAPEQYLRKVTAVEYRVSVTSTGEDGTTADDVKVTRITRQANEPYGPFGLPIQLSALVQRVEPTIHLSDGSTQTLDPLSLATDDEDADARAARYRLVSYRYGNDARNPDLQRDLTIVQQTHAGTNSSPFAVASYEVAPTDPNAAGLMLDSYTWPHASATALTTGPVEVRRAGELRWEDGETAFQPLEGKRFIHQRVEMPRPDNRLRVEAQAGGKTQWFHIVPDFDLERFEGLTELWYEVETAAGARRIDPVGLSGLAPARFRVAVEGDLPLRATAMMRIAGGEPKPLGTWARQP